MCWVFLALALWLILITLFLVGITSRMLQKVERVTGQVVASQFV